MSSIIFYLIPVMVVAGGGGRDYRGPSYLKWRMNPEGLAVQWSCKDYGSINNVMVCAVNAEQADHDTLAAQDGVFTFPADLETAPSPAELSALEAALEAAYIPADWLSPSMTWRENLRTVTGMFMFMQRVTTVAGDNPLDWGVTLNTAFRDLPAGKQEALLIAFDTLGYDSSVVKTNWTLRVVLKNAADQWGERPIYFGFVDL
jgi:hypothetical protein